LTVETAVKPPETARELADVGQRQEKINYRTGRDPKKSWLSIELLTIQSILIRFDAVSTSSTSPKIDFFLNKGLEDGMLKLVICCL
jgi:hypothetical protein